MYNRNSDKQEPRQSIEAKQVRQVRKVRKSESEVRKSEIQKNLIFYRFLKF